MRGGPQARHVLEVGEQVQRDLGAHVGHLELGHNKPKVLDRAHASVDAVADEPGGLVVPLAEEEVERDL